MANTYSLDLESTSSQYATLASHTDFNFGTSGQFTIEAWVKLEASGQFSGVFIRGINDNNHWGLRVDNSVMSFILRSTGLDDSVSSSSLTSGTWYHIAGVRDATLSRLYVDGTEVATHSLNSVQTDNGGNMSVGTYRAQDLTTNYYDGLIDELRVWNVARTPTEINNNKNKELTGSESGLVAYWKFNNVYTDATANAHDLTAAGSPVFSVDVPFVGITSGLDLTSKLW